MIIRRITLVACVDNRGNLYASMFQGNCNILKIQLMLKYLGNITDEKDLDWLLNNIILVDGAANHSSKRIKALLNQFKMPMIIARSYSPPIEIRKAKL